METQSIANQFYTCIVFDNFGIKYANKYITLTILLKAIKDTYKQKHDWTGSKFIGVNFEWNYDKGEIKLSMKIILDRYWNSFNSVHHCNTT